MIVMHPQVESRIEARARTIAEHVIASSVAARAAERRWDPALFRRLGELGVLCPGLPSAYGGSDYTPIDEQRHLVGLGRGGQDAGLCAAVAAHAHGCAAAIAEFGSAELRARYLPAMAHGLVVGALAERDPQDAVAAAEPSRCVRATVLADGRLQLDGVKRWVLNGPVADVFVVTATLEADGRFVGSSALLVERGTPGLRVGPELDTSGLRTARHADVFFDGCVVQGSHRLSAPGLDPEQLVRALLLREGSMASAPWVGLMRATLERCIFHVNHGRVRSGALTASQRARAALADMRIQIELADRMSARAARRLLAPGRTPERDAVSSTLLVLDAWVRVSRSAVELAGLADCGSDPLIERLASDAAFASPMRDERGALRAALAATLLANTSPAAAGPAAGR